MPANVKQSEAWRKKFKGKSSGSLTFLYTGENPTSNPEFEAATLHAFSQAATQLNIELPEEFRKD